VVVGVPARPELFVGRGDVLAELDAAFPASRPGAAAAVVGAPAGGAGRVVVQAVHGLGGIGKSTLAAYWALVHARGYGLVCWVTADSQAGIETGLGDLAVALDPDGAAGAGLEVRRERAVAWLVGHGGWLLVLDNVTDPAHVAPLLARLGGAGHVLITSRRAAGWHGIATPVRLDVLALDEAVGLLTAILATPAAPGAALLTEAGRLREDMRGPVEAVCREVGCLPLAVEQAGAYLAQTGLTPGEYLGLLRRYPAQMFAAAGEGTPADRTVARIWRITLDQLADTPLAGDVLRVLAWWAPDAVPRTLLDGLGEPLQVAAAVGRLAAYNLITLTAGGPGGDSVPPVGEQSAGASAVGQAGGFGAEVDPLGVVGAGRISVHQLVQAVARTPDPDDPHRTAEAITRAREQATSALAQAVPRTHHRDPAGWPAWRVLLPHVQDLTGHTPLEAVTGPGAYLMNQAAVFLQMQGVVYAALAMSEHTHAAYLHLHGPDHPDTLTSVNNLALAYQVAGQVGRAVPLYEQALEARRRVLGEEHPDTLRSVNNLAGAYRVAGQVGRAVPLYEQALEACRRVLGEEHPDTLRSVNNLALAYRVAGQVGRAVPLLEQALEACRRVLGVEHPDTLMSVNNLAAAYRVAGQVGRAVPLLEQALEARRRVLGAEHPDTLRVARNLDRAREEQGEEAG
jgi:tetratricopeptide (TPR) repeat protein